MIAALHLIGPVPSKKNRNRRSRGGRMHLPADVAQTINGLIAQARSQWRRDTLTQAKVHMEFHVTERRADLDNKYTTIQDVLVKAGVLKSDNIRHVAVMSAMAVWDGQEFVRVELS